MMFNDPIAFIYKYSPNLNATEPQEKTTIPVCSFCEWHLFEAASPTPHHHRSSSFPSSWTQLLVHHKQRPRSPSGPYSSAAHVQRDLQFWVTNILCCERDLCHRASEHQPAKLLQNACSRRHHRHLITCEQFDRQNECLQHFKVVVTLRHKTALPFLENNGFSTKILSFVRRKNWCSPSDFRGFEYRTSLPLFFFYLNPQFSPLDFQLTLYLTSLAKDLVQTNEVSNKSCFNFHVQYQNLCIITTGADIDKSIQRIQYFYKNCLNPFTLPKQPASFDYDTIVYVCNKLYTRQVFHHLQKNSKLKHNFTLFLTDLK